ncbi:MAG: hypothetical protein KDA22_13205 [Phycisphaerales bacterium]|nr:hypothetical protein [Phycisphaerales bacterium]
MTPERLEDRIARAFPRRATGIAGIGLVLAGILGGGCSGVRYNASKATDPYPERLHTLDTIDIQVFHESESILLVNATLRDFDGFRLWVNQRYVREVESLKAGEQLRLPLNQFWDQWGGGPNPGGLFRRYEPTPVRLVEIEVDDATPMVGLVAVPTNEELASIVRNTEQQ